MNSEKLQKAYSAKPYTFTQYQIDTLDTALYPDANEGTVLSLAYCGLGLGEAGEVQGKIKKIIRDNNGIVSEEARQAIKAELGDVLWYIARMAYELRIDLDDVARDNREKLLNRKARGVLGGNGDNR